MELVAYKDYLKSGSLVKLNELDYYENWVRRFLKLELSDRLSNYDKIKQYIESLAVDECLNDWQRDQGRKAVEIYLNMFLKNVEERKMDHDLRYSQIMEGMKIQLRLQHYAYRTEQTYLDWVKKYLYYCLNRRMDSEDSSSVKLYLTYLAIDKKVAGGTQNQAFNSILFLFIHILKKDLDDIKGSVRAKKKVNLPSVLSIDEIKSLFEQVDGTRRMILELIYGAGLRVSELAGLRMKDVKVNLAKPYLRIAKSEAKGSKTKTVNGHKVKVGNGATARQVPLWWDQGTLDDLRAVDNHYLQELPLVTVMVD